MEALTIQGKLILNSLEDRSWLLKLMRNFFPEVISPGFSKDKARDLRQKALAKLDAAAHGARYFMAEDLSGIQPSGTRSASGANPSSQ